MTGQCEFCDIARGDAAAEVICDGNEWVAFFPINPATPGHTLVIPRIHASNLWELDASTAARLMTAVVRVGRAIDRALSPDGMNLITSAGRTAEQTVFHVHLHVVPRWENDGFGQIWPTQHRYQDAGLGDVAQLIRESCVGAEGAD